MNAYGPAECSDDVSFFRVDTQSTGGTYLPIGQATDNNHLQVLDDDLLPVPLGGIGELYVSGTGVGRGYLADPGRTALAFLSTPTLRYPAVGSTGPAIWPVEARVINWNMSVVSTIR